MVVDSYFAPDASVRAEDRKRQLIHDSETSLLKPASRSSPGPAIARSMSASPPPRYAFSASSTLAWSACPSRVPAGSRGRSGFCWIDRRHDTKKPARRRGRASRHPDIEFVRPCKLCPHMKRITLPKIRRALETLTHEVKTEPSVAKGARRAVERMLAV
jgi:Quinolinate synthetase A protein